MILALLFCFVAVVFTLSTTQQPPPKRCCSKNRWEGYFGITEGYAVNSRTGLNVAQVTAFLAYDANKKRYAVKEAIAGGGNATQRIRVIADYRKKKMYSIDENGGTCVYVPLDTPFTPACIPEGATYLGTSYHGGPRDQLAYNAWNYNIVTDTMLLNGTYTITKKDCLPVLEEFNGSVRQSGVTVSLVMSMGYGGITFGIKDASIFKPPTDCRPAVADEESIYAKHPLHKYIMAKANMGRRQPLPNDIPQINIT